MHELVFFNRQIVSLSGPEISAVSSAALYGKGVFTTLAIRNKKPSLWEKHWRRLNDDAEKIGVELSEFSEEFAAGALGRLIEENEIENARARITFFDESASRIWHFETNKKTALLMTTAEPRTPPETLRLTLSPFPVNSASPLAGVKSCNYLENILALEDAKRRGFDEAVRLNERGEIAGAATANLFWTSGGELFTPALATGCLAGTTREFLLENHPVSERAAPLKDLAEADEIFLTSAGIGVCPALYETEKSPIRSMISKLKETLDLIEV